MSLYRVLLHLYPRSFRERFGPEMEHLFEESRPLGGGILELMRFWGRTLSDLGRSVLHERLSELSAKGLVLAIVPIGLACGLAYVDSHATEVQVSVFFILLLTGAFSLAWPRGVWRWFLLFGFAIPAYHIGRMELGLTPAYPILPNAFGSLLAVIPAAIGTVCGLGVRRTLEAVR